MHVSLWNMETWAMGMWQEQQQSNHFVSWFHFNYILIKYTQSQSLNRLKNICLQIVCDVLTSNTECCVSIKWKPVQSNGLQSYISPCCVKQVPYLLPYIQNSLCWLITTLCSTSTALRRHWVIPSMILNTVFLCHKRHHILHCRVHC